MIGIIPARYGSSRLPGKPIVDICGKPMIWWVYNQVKQVKELEEVYIATDNVLIKDVCDKYNMNVIMTSSTHNTHIERIQEVSEKIQSDLYLCVCGDEPLIDSSTIKQIIPKEKISDEEYFVSALMREFNEPTEVIDPR